MHTKHDGLVYTWTIPMNKKHYVRVFIWKNKNIMREAIGVPGAHAYARAGAYATKQAGRRSKNLIPRKFGELHFYKAKVGSGIVAHEVQHLINYWIIAAGWNNSAHDEQIAYLCGDLVSGWWRGWYDHIQGEEDAAKQTKIVEDNLRETQGERADAIIRCFLRGGQPN